MGGATVSKNGKTPQSVLEQLRKQILLAFPNLQPDSDATLFNPATKEAKLFKVTLKGPDDDIKVEFEEMNVEETKVNLATAAAIAVTNIYHKKPRKGFWEGCIHLHT